MKKSILHIAMAVCSVFCLLSCDEHEPVDLNIHVGYILCSDGRIIDNKIYDESKHRAVAVVFAEQTSKHPVLAVLLDELDPVAFADTLSFDQGTSCSVDSCDGYANTVALTTTWLSGMRETKTLKDGVWTSEWVQDAHRYGSPLALSSFCSHYYFQSDYIPSVMELQLLYKSLWQVNPVIEMCGGTPVGTTPEDAGCWYWSSTEVSGNSSNQSWLVSMADGSQHKAPKTNPYRARLVVEYNPYKSN